MRFLQAIAAAVCLLGAGCQFDSSGVDQDGPPAVDIDAAVPAVIDAQPPIVVDAAPIPPKPPGNFGDDCRTNTDCSTGVCAQIKEDMPPICTRHCMNNHDCPATAQCDDTHFCVP
jgi:hypothetical protein